MSGKLKVYRVYIDWEAPDYPKYLLTGARSEEEAIDKVVEEYIPDFVRELKFHAYVDEEGVEE